MKLSLTKNSNIYILCPANVHTGGPKCLHQLAYELKNVLKKKVYMYYFPMFSEKYENPVHENYNSYQIPFTNKIDDNEDNLLIVPEMNKTIEISKKYKNIKKVLWWLSVDFFLLTKFNDNFSKYLRSLIKIPYNFICFFNKVTQYRFGNLSLPKYLKLIYFKNPFYNVLKLKDFQINLVHSFYQMDILRSKNLKGFLLSDFIEDDFFQEAEKINIEKKENVICYNPNKSSVFMKKIIESNQEFKFVPLTNLKKKDVIEKLSESKIYIDFGFHPGKDHMPREAAILKNCILTNKEGSAFYFEDVPINDEFKFDEKKKNLDSINKIIIKIFKDYKTEINKFESYRKKLKDQKKTFKNEVNEIFN